MPSSRPPRSRRPEPTRSQSAIRTATSGLYSIQAYLNSFVKTGHVERHDRHGSGPHGQLLRAGPRRCRSAGGRGQPADRCRSARAMSMYRPGTTASTTRPRRSRDILRVNAAGQVVQVIPVADDPYLSLSGVELDPVNNMLYAAVTTSFNGLASSSARRRRAARVRPDHRPAGGDHPAARR